MKTNLNKNTSSSLKKRFGLSAIAMTAAHALVLGGATLFLASCSSATDTSSASSSTTNSQSADGKLAVSASFYPLAWLAQEIGGDAVTVSSITPTNAEPHDFELAPKDVAALSDANLLLYVKGFQPSLDDAAATISGPTVLDLSEAVDLEEADAATADHEHAHGHDHADADHDHDHDEAAHSHDHDHGNLDPHFWLDPERMADAAEHIEEAFTAAAPAHKAEFAANLATLESKLDKLDHDYDNGLKQCAVRTFVTSHAAFGYIARHNDLTQASISGIDPESEPSPADLAAVKKVIEESGTTTIFTEELVSPKTAEAVASETGATVDILSPLESQPESGDYITAMEANLTALKAALQCK